MKKALTFITVTMLAFLVTGCARNLRRTDANPVVATQAPAPISAPTEAPAQVNPTPTTGVSRSDQITNNLDNLLNQFDQALNSVDTLPNEP